MKEEWFEKVVALSRDGKGEAADKIVEEKTRTIPGTAQDFFDRGMAFWWKGDLEAALGDFTRCVEMEPDDFEANLRVGWVLSTLDRHEEAIEVFEKIIRLKPEEYHGYHGFSQALFSLGRYEEALKYNEDLIERIPSFRGFWELGRIGALNQLRRYSEALDSFLLLKPEDIKPLPSYAYYLNLAETLLLLKRFDDALEALQEGMEKTKLEGGCIPCFVNNIWRVPYFEPLSKPPYRERLEEIIGPKPRLPRNPAPGKKKL